MLRIVLQGALGKASIGIHLSKKEKSILNHTDSLIGNKSEFSKLVQVVLDAQEAIWVPRSVKTKHRNLSGSLGEVIRISNLIRLIFDMRLLPLLVHAASKMSSSVHPENPLQYPTMISAHQHSSVPGDTIYEKRNVTSSFSLACAVDYNIIRDRMD